MKIKRIEIVPIRPFEGLIAFANVVLEEGLYLGSIGVHRKLDGGFRITFPTRKVGEANLCIYHPMTPEISKEFETAICSKAEEVFAGFSTV
jgi:DNA-binding cell septation regulator SpoVG